MPRAKIKASRQVRGGNHNRLVLLDGGSSGNLNLSGDEVAAARDAVARRRSIVLLPGSADRKARRKVT